MPGTAIPGARPARERLGLTQADVARRLGMHRQQYQAYESGKVEPTLQRAAEIAAVLGVTIDELAGRDSTQPTESAPAVSGALHGWLALLGNADAVGVEDKQPKKRVSP